jgi:hypothetical protein
MMAATQERAAAAPSLLPTAKTSAGLTPTTAKILLYGEPGVGKTTFCAALGEKVLILATEPGTGGIEAFVQPIRSWTEFRAVGAELAAGKHDFTTLAVDTADELQRMCQEHVCAEHNILHPADLEYGKGWSLVSDEWRLRCAKLANLGLGVIFVSHQKSEEIKQRNGLTYTTVRPAMTGQAGKFLEGFVDFVLHADIEEDENGTRRVVHSEPSQFRIAKQRVVIPSPLPLDGAAFAAALEPPKKKEAPKATEAKK